MPEPPSPSDATSPIAWTEEGAPRSRLFGDIYYSLQDGLAETRAVFFEGCGLPEAWAGRRSFTVAELGFGSGLNIAALLHLWRRTRPPGAHLQIFSLEAYPMSAAEADRALAHWPELAAEREAIVRQWPAARGFHRLDFPDHGATLDLAIAEVETALAGWSGPADAWFLDGFSPAANPQMWRDEVLALVGARSAPGARAATFTVAGQVRRGLAAAGFEVAKRPGHGRKRERLEAWRPGPARPQRAPGQIAVIGAGVAGASLARAFRAQGAGAVVIDAGGGASRNPAALATPGLDAGGGAKAELYAQAFARAGRLYRREAPGAVIAEGVLRRSRSERDLGRFAKVAAQDIYPAGELQPREDGLFIAGGLVLEPAQILAAWLDEVRPGRVDRLERFGNRWRIHLEDGGREEADQVVLAAGWGAAALTGLPLSPIRGQLAHVRSAARPAPVVDGDYLIPTRDGFLFGATHDRGRADAEASEADLERNLASLARLAPDLAGPLAPETVIAQAAVRAVTADRLPVAGELEPGLFILGGLGSRGFCTAPLLAEHVCAQLLGRPSPLPNRLAALVEPARLGREPR